MKGWFELESCYDLSWYVTNDKDPGEFNMRKRFLLEECIQSAMGKKLFGDGTTYWFEPIMFNFHGPMKDGFRYSWPNAPDKRLLALREEWSVFTELAERFPKPAVWHFLAAREYKGRRKAVAPEPICLINTPHNSGDLKRMYAIYWNMADRKSPAFEPMAYCTEAWNLNERFVERNTDEL